MKSCPVVNVHCHLLNFKHLPDRMVKLLSHIPEDLADDRWFSVAAGFLFAIIPGKRYDRIRSFLNTYRCEDFDKLTRDYLKQSAKAGIDVVVPLMMDLEQASHATASDKNIPYAGPTGVTQIGLMSRQASLHPWKLFPFVMFDPRRAGSAKVVKDALENKGFIGVKMYPALGYHPAPRVLGATNPGAAKQLEEVYSFCSGAKVPITVHCSTGGAYSTAKGIDPEKDVWPLTEVSNWLEPLEQFKLKINFAHFGGNPWSGTKASAVQATAWRRQIASLVSITRSTPNRGSVYADVAYHDMALEMPKRYFENLNELLRDTDMGRGLLFGTDASMISHTYGEKEYVAAFKKKVGDTAARKRLFTANPIAFLFEDGCVPDSYVRFLKKAAPSSLDAANLPDWIENVGTRFRVVTG